MTMETLSLRACQTSARLAVLAILGLAGAVSAQGPPATPVRFTEARSHAVRRSIVLSGSVESRRTSVVATEVEGVVAELVAREGDRVRKGAPLARLRRQNLELRLQALKGQLKEAEARQTLARTSLERNQGLFEEKIISQQQLDDASSEFEAWEGRVEQLEADVKRLEDDLARTTVKAPFSGVVVGEHVAEGEWVNEGGAILDLVDFEDLEVTVEVPESSFSGLQTGLPARVVITSLQNLEVEGEVRAVVPRADARARTFPVKISIGNAEGRVAVGMLSRVFLPVGEPEPSIIVPKDAVVAQGAERIVFRIADGDSVERLTVSIGSATGAWVAVRGDVVAGDRIVVRGNERIFPGQQVQPESLQYELP